MAENILVGHSVNDLDCIGSLVLAARLYPGFQPVRSGRLHPGAKNLFTLFRDQLNFLTPKDLKGMEVGTLVVLDTRKQEKIREYLDFLSGAPREVVVWDHHTSEVCDIPGAAILEQAVGSNTSMLALELRERKITISPEEATIALTGVYADTGEFSHDNLDPADFEAAAWLLGMGASLAVVRKLLNRMQHDHQHGLFHDLIGKLEAREINGRKLLVAYQEIEGQLPGLAAVVDQIMEVEDCDALFVTFRLGKEDSHLIVARSRSEGIDLNELLAPFGGGGHPQAASALVRHSGDFPIHRHLIQSLKLRLSTGTRASSLMRPVPPILDSWSLMDASLHLESINESGAVVVDSDRGIVGVLTLRDIQKGRKHNQMHAPVRAFMSKSPVVAGPEAGLREIEQVFYRNDVGHIPILEDHRYLGMVSRTCYLDFLRKGAQGT